MDLQEIIGLTLAGLVMLLGLVGTVVPGIPGAPLVLIAAIGHKLYFRDSGASYFALGLLVFFLERNRRSDAWGCCWAVFQPAWVDPRADPWSIPV
jgi:uncharacterized protein YqgC (DUF456 family)